MDISKIEYTLPVIRITGNNDQKTLFFQNKDNIRVLPGQFYMLNYKVNQKPFSVSHCNDNEIGFTIMKRGKITDEMISVKEGDFFGLTGPLGNSFTIGKENKYLLIGGGVGAAPIFYLSKYLNNLGIQNDSLYGARTHVYLDFINNETKNTHQHINNKFYTEDGSIGKKGFVSLELEEILKNGNYTHAALCGPEIMMKVTADIISKFDKSINIELSMERYMKCGLGICGSCVMDGIGKRICADGTVFPYETIIQSGEFANYHRNSGGVIEK